MAVTSGALGFRRYFVEGKLPSDVRGEFEAAIRRHAFVPFGENDPREETHGWAPADNLFGDDFYPDKWLDSGAVRLTLRVDRRRIPVRMLKYECEKIQAEWKEKFSRERLTRPEKEQIKEMVAARLLARALPDTRGVDFYWEMDRGELFFLSSGEKPNELFKSLFEKTFGVRLSPVFPFALALAKIGEKDRAKAEGVSECSFAEGRV